jgi:hypothetical protein
MDPHNHNTSTVSTMTAIGSNLVFPWELVAWILATCSSRDTNSRAIDESIAWFPTLLVRLLSAAVEGRKDRLNVQGKGTVLPLLLLRLLRTNGSSCTMA